MCFNWEKHKKQLHLEGNIGYVLHVLINDSSKVQMFLIFLHNVIQTSGGVNKGAKEEKKISVSI